MFKWPTRQQRSKWLTNRSLELTLALYAALFSGIYALAMLMARTLLALGCTWHWLNFTFAETAVNMASGIISVCICGAIEWFDQERKRKLQASGQGATMI
jgi:hypothetical protein